MDDCDLADRMFCIAVHEAGHSAVAFALGYAPRYIWLKIHVSNGLSYVGRAGYRSTGNAHHDFATIAAAGEIAAARYCRLYGLQDRLAAPARGDRMDMACAARQAGWRNPETFLRLARHRASAALGHPIVWRGVVALARALHPDYWDGQMPGAEAEAILRKAGVRPGILGGSDINAKVERFARRIR